MGDGWGFRLLGPLEVRHGDVLVPVPATKQRVLLAVLALAANEPVTVDRLITCLWGDRPPPSSRNTLQNYVLRLRRTLTVDDEPCPLVTTAAGYHLEADADAIDVHRFRTLLGSARSEVTAGEPESASELLDEALRLWHGDPLSDIPSEVLHREVVPGLVEQRMSAQEQRIDLALRLGRHRELVPDLIALTTEHPLRERMRAQLMLALYRCGRSAEALDVYRQASTVLAEELGIDPGTELQRVYQAVLTNDPDLTITDPVPGVAGLHPVVPRQLPAPIGFFVGRTQELRHLDSQLAAASNSALMVISAIGGTAGIGKTTLAVHWGHHNADRFPDGQLYVNLRGFDPSGAPVPSAAAVRGFLTALGVPAQQIPADSDERVMLYRSQLADRRMLVVLDNARDAEQVRPLLPGVPGCVVLVTSRNQLAGLVAIEGAVPLTLDLLTRDDAHDLLIRRLGVDCVEREQSVVDELIELCARLPLAVNIAAAHAALHPTRPLAALVDELRDAHRRLDTLSTGEAAADVRAVFSWSYRRLTPEAARVFRLLGVHPGSDIGLAAAASLTALDPGLTRRLLDELTRAHLVTERASGRYTFHDLLRAYAADQSHICDTESERQAALRRLCDFYTHTAYTADRILYSHRPPIQLAPPVPGARPEPLADVPSALAWLEAEHANLLAAQHTAAGHAWHLTVWQLAWTLYSFQVRRGRDHDRLAVWQAALEAAAHLPDPAPRILAHRLLGFVYSTLRCHEEGIGHLYQALALAEEHHDTHQQAHTHRGLASSWALRGDNRKAVDHATRNLDLVRTLNEPEWEAGALGTMGWYLAQFGDYDTARAHCHAALALHRQHRNLDGEAENLSSLGYIDHHTGRHRQAVDHYQQALIVYRCLGDISEVAGELDTLGHPYVALGEYERARTVWREALELYRQQGRDQDADRVRRQLDTLNHPDDQQLSGPRCGPV
ncbi:BTAD domain-containing putative transcriptional regulator [Kutzneria viridogrisea]|uniref:DNA-binding SARP family transcriptional activator/tetratricopeptide (TPR) repeat protein n=1 Tax=Kutzneria viridogrisea TaxID=47990 RepID=A0ABR6B9M0_9PSEU|nr:DNA-binding SARP family transcriptional activator/tetratricopeptide (TPR) repeat protein [Kutzneria viridogrisea]